MFQLNQENWFLGVFFLIFTKFAQICVDNDNVDRFYSCRSPNCDTARHWDNILLNHKIFEHRHQQKYSTQTER